MGQQYCLLKGKKEMIMKTKLIVSLMMIFGSLLAMASSNEVVCQVPKEKSSSASPLEITIHMDTKTYSYKEDGVYRVQGEELLGWTYGDGRTMADNTILEKLGVKLNEITGFDRYSFQNDLEHIAGAIYVIEENYSGALNVYLQLGFGQIKCH
jgi:hypothetical protein